MASKADLIGRAFVGVTLDYYRYLVVLSVFVAVQAGYVGLSLAQRIPSSFATGRRLLIAGSAITLSVGIWSMHFIGMLAIKTSAVVDYLVLPTLVSFLVCVLVTGVATYLASLRSRRMIIGAAVFMGSGITAMHYVGMLALGSSAQMHNNPVYAGLSIALAIMASGLALWIAFFANNRFPTILGAVVFGFAVSGMHYTAMAGMSLHYMTGSAQTASFITSDILAMIVSIVAFSISAIFMLTLIPRDPMTATLDPKWAALEAMPSQSSAADKDMRPLDPPQSPESMVAYDAPATLVPIEKNGDPFHISAKDIVSVHANAHYTYIFNGRDDFFCPLSISEVDEKLASPAFFRTHRSYIVNLHHIDRIQKSGDAAVAELRSAMRRNVPVARARVGQLRKEVANFKQHQAAQLARE